MTSILIVGASDTGRAPMAAALLRQMVEQRGLAVQVASAGVVGHDDDPPEQEARTAMLTFGLNIDSHRARSVANELVSAADELVAIDSGTARVLRARFPGAGTRIWSLGELAGRNRDVPDPFRMDVGAWITYAHELASMLAAALDSGRWVALAEPTAAEQSNALPTPTLATTSDLPAAALARILRLLDVQFDMPALLHWEAARARIEVEIGVATQPRVAADMAPAYGGLLRAALALSTNPPKPTQTTALRAACVRLEHPVTADDLTWLSMQIGGWQGK